MKRNRQLLIIILVVIVIILLAPRLPWGHFVSRGLLGTQSWLRSYTTTPAEKDLLIEMLTAEVARLSAIESENEELRRQLSFFQKQEFQRVSTYILSKDPFNSNFLTLAAGSNQAVALGQPVIVGEGILIGKIISVEAERSLVELLTSDVSKVPAMVSGGSATNGLLQCNLGTSLVLQYVPNEIELQPSELIVTSGLEQQTPRGLVIGTVESIEKSESDIFSSAKIKPAVDYLSQYIVTIIVVSQ